MTGTGGRALVLGSSDAAPNAIALAEETVAVALRARLPGQQGAGQDVEGRRT
ncbi:MAG: hypothetical protein ACM3ML_35725 [Micromonosporaceae bacterium]